MSSALKARLNLPDRLGLPASRQQLDTSSLATQHIDNALTPLLSIDRSTRIIESRHNGAGRPWIDTLWCDGEHDIGVSRANRQDEYLLGQPMEYPAS